MYHLQGGDMIKIIFVLMLSATSVMAGVTNGGGGKAVVCRAQNGKIYWAELLDLYESRELFGLNLINQSLPVNTIVDGIKLKLKSSLDQADIHLFPLIDRVNNIFRLISKNNVIKPIDDAAEVALLKDCALEQLANYVDDDLLIVSQEIWDNLDNTNKAALIIHEAIYRQERYYGATDSRRARKIVGHLFADYLFTPVKQDLPINSELCIASKDENFGSVYTQFYRYPTANGASKLQFTILEGKLLYSKKTAELPIQMPWYKNSKISCSGSSSGCNISGAPTSSHFENSGFIVLGTQTKVHSGGMSEILFYFVSEDGSKSYIRCQSPIP